MKPRPTETVRELALSHPAAAAVLEDLKIDYCCGGDRSLVDACAKVGASAESVRQRIGALARTAEDVDWITRPLGDLIDHILETHHAYDRRELARLRALSAKVFRVHGNAHPELVRVASLVGQLASELESHMTKEERVLFPYVRALEGGGGQLRSPFGTVANPVRMMMREHEAVGALLLDLRAVTNSFAAPEDGCASYSTLYAALPSFERELHQHIHLENNILFPAAIALEKNVVKG